MAGQEGGCKIGLGELSALAILGVATFFSLACQRNTVVHYHDFYPIGDAACSLILPHDFSFGDHEEFNDVAGLAGALGGKEALYMKRSGGDWVMLSLFGKEDSPDVKELDEARGELLKSGLIVVSKHEISGVEVWVQPEAGIVGRNGVRPNVTDVWLTIEGKRFLFVFAGKDANEETAIAAMKELVPNLSCS